MLTNNFSYNGASVTVKRETMRARLQKNIVYRKLGITPDISDEEWEYMDAFAHLLTQCDIVGDVGFPVAQVADTAEDMRTSYEAFLDSEGSLYTPLIKAINEVDAPLGDPDLTPGKKTTAADNL